MTFRPVIALTVHNRPEYLKPVLESWAQVRGIERAEMIFRCEPGCDETVALCEAVDLRPQGHHDRQPGTATGCSPTRGTRWSPRSPPGTGSRSSARRTLPSPTTSWSSSPGAARSTQATRTWSRCAPAATGQETPTAASGKRTSRDPHFSPIVWGTWRAAGEDFFRRDWDFTYAQARLGLEHQPAHQRAGQARRDSASPGPCTSGNTAACTARPDFYPQTVAASFHEHYEPRGFREIPGRWPAPQAEREAVPSGSASAPGASWSPAGSTTTSWHCPA